MPPSPFDRFEEALERFNDDFPVMEEIKARLDQVFGYIEECGFSAKSRAWRKADLFTLFIEIDELVQHGLAPQPLETVDRLDGFYQVIDSDPRESIHAVYYKATIQASNDRLNRVRRGVVVNGVLLGYSEDDIMLNLSNNGLV